jgi:hypothetical protein
MRWIQPAGWIVLILAALLIAGCSELAYSIRREIIDRHKDPKNRGISTSSYQYESDSSKAHHEQTVINTLNGWIGNRSTY